jgi:hypothetical protein
MLGERCPDCGETENCYPDNELPCDYPETLEPRICEMCGHWVS